REWDVIEERAIVVAIECSPSTVPILHADHPVHTELDGFGKPGLIRIGGVLEGHQHEGGVVHIGIKIISELERPTARRRIAVFDLPVAAAENLVLEKPSDGFL